LNNKIKNEAVDKAFEIGNKIEEELILSVEKRAKSSNI